MARKDQNQIKSSADALRFLSEQIKKQATRPNIYGYEAQHYQVPFHKSLAKGRQFLGGNRTGKTVSGAAEMVMWLTGRHPYRPLPELPIRGRIVSVDFKQGVEKIVKPEIMRWMPASELRGKSWTSAYDNQTDTLWLENGSFVEFMSYEQALEKFAGTSRHCIWFDEEPPKDIFDECKARLIDTGGSWWMSMTPVNGMTWTYDDIFLPATTGTDPFTEVFVADMTQNKYLGELEVEGYLSGLSDDDKKIRGSGQYVAVGGLILGGFNSDINVVEPYTPSRDHLWVASMDHGLNAPSAWLWHAVGPTGQVHTFFEHYKAELTVEEHAKVVHTVNSTYKRVPDYYIGDPAIAQRNGITGTSIQYEYADRGINIMLGNNEVTSGLERLRHYLGTDFDLNGNKVPRWIINRNCVNLIREIPRYRWAQWTSSRAKENNNDKETPVKRNDHAIDSARYFFMSRPQHNMADRSVRDYSHAMEASAAVSIEQYAGDEEPQTRWKTESINEYMGSDW